MISLEKMISLSYNILRFYDKKKSNMQQMKS